jgi:hypothetical protein
MWTRAETISTGSSIETVKLSNRKDQDRSSSSESNQVARETVTEEPAKATSKNATQLSKEARATAKQAKIWTPVVPSFLPRSPEAIEARRGRTIIARYIVFCNDFYLSYLSNKTGLHQYLNIY